MFKKIGGYLGKEKLNSESDAGAQPEENTMQSEQADPSEIYKEQFIAQLQAILDKPYDNNYICRCCGAELQLDQVASTEVQCFFSGLQLYRHICPDCGVVFGPMQMIFAESSELAELYSTFYKYQSEGDTRRFQEKTFYLMNPSVNNNYLNYACGDFDDVINNLRVRGWNIYGVEPFQQTESEYIFTSASDIGIDRFDGLMTSNYLEHVQNPLEFFKDCEGLLADEGVMVHSTPCYSFVFDFTPFHLFFYTGSCVEKLAERTGFRITNVYRSDTEPENLGFLYECRVFERVRDN